MGNDAAEIFGDGLPHIGQRVAYAEIHASTISRRIGEDRDIFARVVGRRPTRIRIATVVRGDHQQVGKTEQRQKFSEHVVEFLERFSKPLDVLAVAVKHIEVHKVAENQSVFSLLRRSG